PRSESIGAGSHRTRAGTARAYPRHGRPGPGYVTIHDSRIAATRGPTLRGARSTALARFACKLRLQIRRAHRFRPGVRRSIPAESDLCTGTEAIHRCRPESRRLHELALVYARVPRSMIQLH